MQPGWITRLRSAYSRGRLSHFDVCKILKRRIDSDRNAVMDGKSISELQIPATNSINSCSDYSFIEESCNRSGNLTGIPFLVKDNFCVSISTGKCPTSCSSKMLSQFRSPYTASVVESYLNAGAVFMGKTNMDEFAMGSGSIENIFTGPVVNPWSKIIDEVVLPRIAGGSSGGSAASVAAGFAVAALASDTGGSCRHPAALCGVVGLKPTYGLASRYGLIPLANTMDCPSLIAPHVDDVRLLLSEWLNPSSGIRGPLSRLHDATLTIPLNGKTVKNIFNELSSTHVHSKSSAIRIGIPREFYTPDMTTEVASIWDQVAGWVADDFNMSVKSVSLPHTPIVVAVYAVLCAVEVASNMSRYDGLRYGLRVEPSEEMKLTLSHLNTDTCDGLIAASREIGFGPQVCSRILAGNFFLLRDQREKHLKAARRLWRLIKEDFDQVFQDVDFLLTPVNLTPSLLISEFSQLNVRRRINREDACLCGVNLAGLPAITVPITLSRDPATNGLPIGLQLIGRPWSEPQLLALAGLLEERANFSHFFNLPKYLGIN